MTGEVIRFPGRAALHAVPAFSHLDIELGAVASHLRQASRHFDLQRGETLAGDTAIREGANELEAALFHALTALGCLNDDRDLRNLLVSRLARREGQHG